MKKPWVYIAGRYSEGCQASNVNRICSRFWLLRNMNVIPIAPHWSIVQQLSGFTLSYEEWLEYDFSIIDKCDAIWVESLSPGTSREVAHAKKKGIPVFYAWKDGERFVEWVEGFCDGEPTSPGVLSP